MYTKQTKITVSAHPRIWMSDGLTSEIWRLTTGTVAGFTQSHPSVVDYKVLKKNPRPFEARVKVEILIEAETELPNLPSPEELVRRLRLALNKLFAGKYQIVVVFTTNYVVE